MSFQAWGFWGHGSIVSYCPVCPQPGAQLEQPASIADDDLVQATFQQLQNPPSPARPHLLRDTVKQLMLHRERLSLVTGQSGQGKTAFLVHSPRAPGGRKGARGVMHGKCTHVFSLLSMQASLVSALRAPDGAKVAPFVFFHFSGARPDQGLALTLLRRLCAYLHSQLQKPSALPTTYRCVSLISPALVMPQATARMSPSPADPGAYPAHTGAWYGSSSRGCCPSMPSP